MSSPPTGRAKGPAHYRQLVGGVGWTCGLTDAGMLQCWGVRQPTAIPAGTFTQLVATYDDVCGLDVAGALHCILGHTSISEGAPADALAAVATDGDNACGIRKADGGLDCWRDSRPRAPQLLQSSAEAARQAEARCVTLCLARAELSAAPPA